MVVRAPVRWKASPKAELSRVPATATASVTRLADWGTLMGPMGWKALARSIRPLP